MGDNADGHELLAVVAAVHHEGVGETLNDGAVGLAEALGGITTSGVRDVDGGADLDVVAARNIPLASILVLLRESRPARILAIIRIDNGWPVGRS